MRLLAVIALLFTGCATSPTVSIPRVPAWVPVPVEVEANQVLGESLRLTGTVADLSDSRFTPVAYEWLERTIPWTRQFASATGFAYTPQSLDCDKFAKAFSLAAEIAAARAGVKAQPLAARIYVRQVFPFGGVPAGGAHALNAVATERGIIIVEPQSGAKIPLERYPNRQHITKVLIGG